MTKIFAHNDADGRAAAAIAWRSTVVNRQAECIEMDYKNPVPVDSIQLNETIFILDFSFTPEVMEKVLAKTKNVVWIDHHETAFKYPYNTPAIRGIRRADYSGCELAWIFFAKDAASMPTAIRLIGDRDKWAWKHGDLTRQFNEGLKMFPHGPTDGMWEDLLSREESLINLLDIGKNCIRYRDNLCADYVKLCGFETELGGLRCFAVNLYKFGSETFGQLFHEYDACIAYVYDGLKWQCSIYSEKHDVKEVAKKYGGGGHPHAAGWTCDTLPFTRKTASGRQ